MLETPSRAILVCQEEETLPLVSVCECVSVCVFVCAHMQACVQKLHVLAMVPLHWMHSCLTECVDTSQPPPFFYFPAPLSVAEAECCTTVLKLTSTGPLGGQNIRLPLLLRAKVAGLHPSAGPCAKKREQRLMALDW